MRNCKEFIIRIARCSGCNQKIELGVHTLLIVKKLKKGHKCIFCESIAEKYTLTPLIATVDGKRYKMIPLEAGKTL